MSIVSGSSSDSVELSQESLFEVQNGEVLEDGSVKLSGDKGSRVVIKDGLRLFDAVITLGEKHFAGSAQFWFHGKLGEVNIYNILSVDGQHRIRTDGNLANGGGSGYKSTNYDITTDELNAMDTYEYKIAVNAEDATKMDMAFVINGTQKAAHTGPNPFYYDQEGSASFYFGFNSVTSDGSWYVVKSCNITVNE